MSERVQSTPGWTPVQRTGAVVAWLWVAVPFAWGVYELFEKIPKLFG